MRAFLRLPHFSTRRSRPARASASGRLLRLESMESRRLLALTFMGDLNPAFEAARVDNLVADGNQLYFSLETAAHGQELWTSDGTQEGTRLVKDLVRGPEGAWPRPLLAHEGIVYFATQYDYEISGDFLERKLWRTDGTTEGTFVLSPSFEGNVVALGDKVYFVRPGHAGPGPGLWESDGTLGGTIRVVFGQGEMEQLTGFRDRLVFVVDSSVSGRELWRFNPHTGDLGSFASIVPGPDGAFNKHYAAGFTVIDDVLYFAANDGIHGRELWRSDGTPSGTYLLADFNPGPASGLEYGYAFDEEVRIAGLGSKIFVAADDGVHGRELWRVDALTGAGEMTADLIPPDSDREPATSPIVIGAFDGAMLFWTDRSEDQLWKVGAQGAPAVVTEFIPVYPHGVAALTDDALYYVQAGPTTNKLVRRDSLSTSKVLMEGTHFGAFTVIDEGHYFIHREQAAAASRLWKSNGTAAGTLPFTDELYGAPEGTFPQGSMTVGDSLFFRTAGDRLWMVRPDFDAAQEVSLVTTDGCPAGCAVKATALAAADDELGLYFLGSAPGAGRVGLWRIDEMAQDVRFISGHLAASRTGVPVVGWQNGRLLFIHPDPATRVASLFKTSADGLGASFVKEFPNSSGFTSSVAFRDQLYFILGRQLWRTDGTTEGTQLVRELPERTGFRALAVANDKLFVAVSAADIESPDVGLWVGDGSRENSWRASDYPYLQGLTPTHDGVYFGLSDVEHGHELWYSDGDSTRLVKDIRPGPSDGLRTSVPGRMIDEWFYFVYETTPGEIDLWRTDGTEPGTTKVLADASTWPFEFAGNLLLRRDTPQFGSELWRIDGTPEGARLVADLNPGPADSYPYVIGILKESVYLLADTPEYGYEPWRLTLDPGDTNFDGAVDLTDLNNVRGNFGATGNVLGDTNGDGVVDLADLNAVRNHFGGPAASRAAATRVSAIQERVPRPFAAHDAVFALLCDAERPLEKRGGKRR